MDILRFINSKDIREHLRSIGYEFNSLETAWLIYQCHDATIDEKHKAWNELIETMPDCPIEKRLNTVAQDSLHAFLRLYMTLEDSRIHRPPIARPEGAPISITTPSVFRDSSPLPE